MSTKTIVANSARNAFLCGVLCTTFNVIVFKRGVRESLNIGIASFVGATAYYITEDLLLPEYKYINERTETDN